MNSNKIHSEYTMNHARVIEVSLSPLSLSLSLVCTSVCLSLFYPQGLMAAKKQLASLFYAGLDAYFNISCGPGSELTYSNV